MDDLTQGEKKAPAPADRREAGIHSYYAYSVNSQPTL